MKLTIITGSCAVQLLRPNVCLVPCLPDSLIVAYFSYWRVVELRSIFHVGLLLKPLTSQSRYCIACLELVKMAFDRSVSFPTTNTCFLPISARNRNHCQSSGKTCSATFCRAMSRQQTIYVLDGVSDHAAVSRANKTFLTLAPVSLVNSDRHRGMISAVGTGHV